MNISVIIPVFNAEKTIENAIESVLMQEYLSLELIIVDGKSSDRTLDIINKYSESIDVVISENDNGYADAMNKGINASTGDYVIMLAADDRLVPNAITRFLETIKSETDVWCGSVILSMPYGYLIRKSNPNLDELYNTCSLENAATFYKREIFTKLGGFSTEYKCANDREMFLRIFKNNACFQIESIPITLFEMGGLSTADPFLYAIPEDEIISTSYGIDKDAAEKNSKKVKRTLLIQRVIVPIKIFLFKIGIISFIYKLLRKQDIYLTRRDMISMGIPPGWLK